MKSNMIGTGEIDVGPTLYIAGPTVAEKNGREIYVGSGGKLSAVVALCCAIYR